MLMWSDILAQRNDSGEALFYVIAVLILSIIGAVFEKFKRKLGEEEVENKQAQPKRRVPARPPVDVERPAAPPARPVFGEGRREATRPLPQQPRPRPPQERKPVRTHRPPAQPVPIVVEVRAEPVIARVEQPGLQREPGGQPSAVSERKVSTAKEMRVAGVGSFKGLSRQEVRRAIVLNEILGPPLACRDYDRPWER